MFNTLRLLSENFYANLNISGQSIERPLWKKLLSINKLTCNLATFKVVCCIQVNNLTFV